MGPPACASTAVFQGLNPQTVLVECRRLADRRGKGEVGAGGRITKALSTDCPEAMGIDGRGSSFGGGADVKEAEQASS